MTKENTATYKVVLGAMFLTVAAIIAMILIGKMNENISDMMVILSATFVSAYALFNGIRTLLHDVSLNINKNKEQQIQEPEKGNQ